LNRVWRARCRRPPMRSGLDPKVREGVILRVAALCRSPFERMQHLDQARKAGGARRRSRRSKAAPGRSPTSWTSSTSAWPRCVPPTPPSPSSPTSSRGAARLSLARRLRPLRPARDHLRRGVIETREPGSRAAQAGADRNRPAAAPASWPTQAAARRGSYGAPEPPIPARGSSSPVAPRACSRPAPATSTPCRSIPSRTARSNSSTPRRVRSPTSR
jgi:hypothetical protein